MRWGGLESGAHPHLDDATVGRWRQPDRRSAPAKRRTELRAVLSVRPGRLARSHDGAGARFLPGGRGAALISSPAAVRQLLPPVLELRDRSASRPTRIVEIPAQSPSRYG